MNQTIDNWETKGVRYRQVRISPTHIRVEVTTARGRVHACTWATDTDLDRAMIEAALRDDRRSFRPFDTSEGRYVRIPWPK